MRAAAAAAVGQQQQPATTTAAVAAVASNEVKICINGSKKGTPREVGEGCCQEARREHRHSYEQRAAAAQARHSTAQASEQGAEGGGGVLTLPPIDVTDAGMAMVPVRPE